MGLSNQSKPVKASRQRPLVFVMSLFGLLLAGLVIPKVLGHVQLLVTTLISSLSALAIALFGLFSRGDSNTEKSIVFVRDTALTVRALSLGILSIYWVNTQSLSRDEVLLLLLQIPFAYLVAMGTQWRQREDYRLDLMPLLTVLTLNLFVCLTDIWWSLQLLTLAVAVLGQTAVGRTIDGSHARYNVLGLVLAGLSGILILSVGMDAIRESTFARSSQPNDFVLESIFAVGLLTYRIRPVLLTAIGALSSILLVELTWRLLSGGGIFLDAPVPLPVWLGIFILLPDERSGPKTRAGEIKYGLLFGLLVTCIYAALWSYGDLPWGQQLTYFACFLTVPFLGLLVSILDKAADEKRASKTQSYEQTPKMAVLSFLVLAGLFSVLRGPLNPDPTAHLLSLKTACESKTRACGQFVAKWNQVCRDSSALSAQEHCTQSAPMVHRSGCDYGLQEECAALGFSMLASTEIKTRQRGDDLILTACKSGLISACNMRAAGLLERNPGAVDLRRQLSRIACDRGNREGCERLGMVMYQTAKTPTQYKQASEKLYFACQAQRSLACYTLADMLLIGQFGKTSPSRARILFDSACRRGYAKACTRLRQLDKAGPSATPNKARVRPSGPGPQ
ncbi:MAG: hypothetical protein CMH52_13510 [Myxococcales bacterium]|nr:hypothetical protein [Myxococcales bacterium]